MEKLIAAYHRKRPVSLEDIVEYHYEIEQIYPFQDGNGRVGRMIMFKECLAT